MRVLIVLLGLALAGCSRSQPEAVPENVVEPIALPTPAPSPTLRPAPALEPPPAANLSAELPPEPKADPSEQVMDDASTTGMTARANRDEEDTPDVAANEAQ